MSSRNTRSNSSIQRKNWVNCATTAIENLTTTSNSIENYTVRRSIWVNAIKYLLNESELQRDNTENRAIISIQVYRIFVDLLENHYMDFQYIKKLWTSIEDKSKELLVQLENKKQYLSKDSYNNAKNLIHLVQQYQMLRKEKVFGKINEVNDLSVLPPKKRRRMV